MFIGSVSHHPATALRASASQVSPEKVDAHAREHSGSAENAGKVAAQVSLSDEAKAAMAAQASKESPQVEPAEEKAESANELSDDEKREVAELKARDAEVRAHERAHVAAAGGHTKGGIKYETQRGPDNKEYAVGGHVNIDTAPIDGDPEQTIRKAETVRRAALAPAEPSGADRGVAAAAANTARTARAELAEEARLELEQSDESPDDEESSEVLQSASSDEGHSSSSIRSSYAVAAYGRAAA
ncbi:MAG: hypothetical protein JKY56_27410 [Kofleriaceae bacterium]|nr:hypothetical protein [Kofleriaceae bacterium]